MDESTKKTIAKMVSRVFGPFFVWFPMLMLLELWLFRPTLIHSVVLLGIQFVLPSGLLLYLMFVRRSTDVDMTRRQDRVVPLLIISAAFFLAGALAMTLRYPDMAWIVWAYGLATLVATLITVKWKVSYHALWNTAGMMTLAVLVSPWFWGLFIFLPLVFWARIQLKKHNLGQMVIGTILAILIFSPVLLYSVMGNYRKAKIWNWIMGDCVGWKKGICERLIP